MTLDEYRKLYEKELAGDIIEALKILKVDIKDREFTNKVCMQIAREMLIERAKGNKDIKPQDIVNDLR